MTRYLIFVLVLLGFGLSAQENPRDSLEQLLTQDLVDTTRVKVLIESAKTYIADNASKADSLFQSAKFITEQMEGDENKLKAFETVGRYYMHTRVYDSAVT